MALPIILFNSAGSDTAASGAGPATAITGTAAAHTGGAASATITLTNSPDLSGVATDGSACLWLKTSSGRQFSKITGKGAGTVTVEDSFTIASGSAVNYAIGGKRSSWDNADSRTVFGATGARGGWMIRTETDQTLTSALVIVGTASLADGPLLIEGDALRTVTQSANAAAISCNGTVLNVKVRNLKIANSNASKSAAVGVLATNHNFGVTVQGCVLGDGTNQLLNGTQRAVGFAGIITLADCEVHHCTGAGVASNGAIHTVQVRDCYIHHNTNGIESNIARVLVSGCVISANSGDGINLSATAVLWHCASNTIHGNSGDGIDTSNAAVVLDGAVVTNNNLTANGGYGINAHASSRNYPALIDYNNYGTGALANTSGALLNLSSGAHDLAVDPQYTNAAGGDFSVGNAAVKGVGFPGTGNIGAGQSATRSYVDLGAAQAQATAGGGGGGNSIFGSGVIKVVA